MDALHEIARSRHLVVIEDAAEAHGARCRGRVVGSIGDLGCFSFYGNKIMTTGEGGMVTTNDSALATHMRFLKNHAMEPQRRYWHSEVGFNYRMTNLQAAVGCAQVERFQELQRARAQVLGWYRDELSSTAGVQLNPVMEWAETAPWLVCVVLQGGEGARDAVIRRMRDDGFDTRPFFGLLHQMPPYRQFRYYPGMDGGDADRTLSSGGLNLPSGRHVTRDQVRAVAEIVGTVASPSNLNMLASRSW